MTKATTRKPSFFLIKSEPNSRLENGVDMKFSIEDMKAIGVDSWTGVRNHEAKNLMKNTMKVDDLCLFYHSNCKLPGIAGLVRVCKESYPDFTQFDKKSHYYDPKATKEAPRWFMVDVEYVKTFKRFVPLKELQKLRDNEHLRDMPLLNRGRLSVQPVDKKAFDFICNLAESDLGDP
jgi:predicted RNA-binding protein with PUA-like domain